MYGLITMHTTRDAKRKFPAERHGELLDAAVRICADEGLGAVTLRKVANVAGVTPGLVSHYFSSAEELTNATFRKSAQADLAEARAQVAAQTTATGKITALIHYVLDDSSVDAAALWIDVASLGRHAPSLAAEADVVNADWLAFLVEIIEAGVASGEFDVADPEATARRLLTIIDGLGAPAVTQALPTEELQGIAQAFTASELRLVV
jgi:AcrR family transcriptional regulator